MTPLTSTPPSELERLFELSADPLATIDTEGRFAQVNPAWERVLGWAPSELAGRAAVELVHPADRERTEDVGRHVVEAGYDVLDFENRFAHKDGGWRWLLWSAHSDGETWFAVAKDITDRKRLEARTLEDPLTHLPSRAVVVDRLRHARARQARSGSQLAVLFLDLDGFKRANQNFGHEVGDRLLIGASRRLRRLVRESDTIARMGRDEFVVVAEGIGSAANAAMVAGRVVEGFRQPLVPEEPIVLGASVGVALAGPDRHCTAEELMREADTAMHRAKSAGGSQYALMDPPAAPAVVWA